MLKLFIYILLQLGIYSLLGLGRLSIDFVFVRILVKECSFFASTSCCLAFKISFDILLRIGIVFCATNNGTLIASLKTDGSSISSLISHMFDKDFFFAKTLFGDGGDYGQIT